MFDSLKFKFQDEQSKLEFMTEVDKLKERYEAKARQADWVPTAFRLAPVLAVIGIGIHGVKTGWMKKNPHAFIGLSMLAGPASSAMGEFGYRLISNRKKEIDNNFKKDVLKLALKYNASVSVPTGDVKIG